MRPRAIPSLLYIFVLAMMLLSIHVAGDYRDYKGQVDVVVRIEPPLVKYI